MMNPCRIHLVACRVFERELEVLAASATSALRIEYLEMALHEKPGDQLRAALQAAVNAVPAGSANAVALGYGLCNRGLVGLRAASVPVVIPRAHDCLGLLLGSSERYLAELDQEAGTYFQSPGWIEHLPADRTLRPLAAGMGGSLAPNREELVARYGEDNADFLMEELAGMTRHYRRLAFIATPVNGCEGCAHQARDIAAQQGWQFQQLTGDLGWLQRLLDGDWNEREFLVVKPGEQVVLRHDALLIGAEPLHAGAPKPE
jgi:hypothetical protein